MSSTQAPGIDLTGASREWREVNVHTEQPGIRGTGLSNGEATVPWKHVFTIDSYAWKKGLWCIVESWRFHVYR